MKLKARSFDFAQDDKKTSDPSASARDDTMNELIRHDTLPRDDRMNELIRRDTLPRDDRMNELIRHDTLPRDDRTNKLRIT